MVKTKKLLKISIIAISLVVILLALSICFVGCDSTSGCSNTVNLASYRKNSQFFNLPIKVTKATGAPASTKNFRSRMSLCEIFESLSADDKLQTNFCETYIVAKDLSSKNLGYCLIYAKKVDKFNYIASNMACKFYAENNEYSQKEILVPMHLIPSLIGDNILTENKEYEFKSTQEAVVAFYKTYGFEIENSQNGIIVKDTIRLNEGYDHTGTIDSFEIIIKNSSIAFKSI
ncbi:MAG: hypothetical protein RSA24_03645 [Clostridia bacterium]